MAMRRFVQLRQFILLNLTSEEPAKDAEGCL